MEKKYSTTAFHLQCRKFLWSLGGIKTKKILAAIPFNLCEKKKKKKLKEKKGKFSHLSKIYQTLYE